MFAYRQLVPFFRLLVLTVVATTGEAFGAEHEVLLKRGRLTVEVDRDYRLTVYQDSQKPIWQTRATSKPYMNVRDAESDKTSEPVRIVLGDAVDRQKTEYDDGVRQGYRLSLSGFPNTDVEVELIYALAEREELLIQVEQVGGKDVVQAMGGISDWELKSAADAYMVVPRGSGYMIRSDSSQAVKLTGFVGAQYSMPLFGIVRGSRTCYQIIENWWDTFMEVNHEPGSGTTMSLVWEPSHGKLAYPRRVLLRFADDVDHVGMAKAYRRYLIAHKEFGTLKQRAEINPKLKQYLAGMEYRWVYFDPEEPGEYEDTLDNIRRFQEAGLPVSFFFPKWRRRGASWQHVMEPEPIPGGWSAVREMAETIRSLGCTIQVMVNPHKYFEDSTDYDPDKMSDVSFPLLSSRYALESNKRLLDFLEAKNFRFESFYFDGYSEYRGMREHTDAKGPVSRRQNFEAQIACFRETRRRGYLTGGEQARFWSIPFCDYYFFTDWYPDRLREGEPIPLFQLVFHDCYGAHLSGGGYYEEGKYDWYEDRHPRLYELMYAAIPSHNWLPGGSTAIKAEHWKTKAMDRRLKWLKRWHAYYQKVCYEEMLTHQFLNADRTLQRVEFANGIVADFDLVKGLYRVAGVPGFSNDWERPEEITR